MGINEEVARAFGSHTLWKARVERAADAGKSEFTPEDVCRDNLCTFGKWLHDPALSPEVRAWPHYGQIKHLHAEFHKTASEAIRQAVSGDAAGAKRNVASGPYTVASERLYKAMFSWQRDATVPWSRVKSPLLRKVFDLVAGRLAMKLWGAVLVPSAAALGGLFFIHAHADALRQAGADLALMDGLFATALIVGLLAMIGLARSVIRPMHLLTDATRALAKGDLTVSLPGMRLGDELGELSRAVLVFQEQSLAVERIAAARENERSRSEAERRAALVHMAESIESQTSATIGRIAHESERVHETAKRMAKGALAVEENAQLVAAAAEQSLVNAQTTAAATDKLSASIHHIAEQMDRSRAVVADAVAAADNASATVDQLSQAMAAIDQVVQLIAEIASQTNLLALNATIEAARAGDAGKGFAVVANEVKNLANQTARQTSEITGRIAHLNEMAGKVRGAISGTVGKVQDVEIIATEVAQSVEEQKSATDQISRNVMQSAQAARSVADRIVEVADEAVSTGRQAGEVEQLLQDMSEQVGELGRTLTKMVRTSTPEVNRRGATRYEMETDAKLASGTGTVQGKLADISATGARVVGVPSLHGEREATLQIDGMDMHVSVVESRDGMCRVKIDEDERPQVENWINRKVGSS